MATIEGVRALALSLPRSYEALVRDRVKFRVGRIVYLAFSRDETLMGFAFPKEERDGLVAAEPDKFVLPRRRTCATTGSWCASPPSTTSRCASSSSTRGGWSCPSASPRRTSATDPTAG